MPRRRRFAAAGMGKVALLPWDHQTWRELAAIGAYMAWSPLLLWLIKRRSAARWLHLICGLNRGLLVQASAPGSSQRRCV